MRAHVARMLIVIAGTCASCLLSACSWQATRQHIPDPPLLTVSASPSSWNGIRCATRLLSATELAADGSVTLQVSTAEGGTQAAYFTVAYDARRWSLQLAQAGPAWLQDQGGQLLELYVTSEAGRVYCGQCLANWDRRRGLSSGGVIATLTFADRPAAAAPRVTASPPDAAASQAHAAWDAGAGTLRWRYYNQGDYDQNGEVNIADITPLGLYFQQLLNYPADENTVQAVADGDGNGEINLADITPIGSNFGKDCLLGWHVYSCNDPAQYPAGPTDDNGTAVQAAQLYLSDYDPNMSPWTERLLYQVTIAAPNPGDVYWVRPVDSDGVEGIASNFTPSAANQPPVAVIASHGGAGDGTSGTAPHFLEFDGSSSYDPDGDLITSYDWDFESDGTVDANGPQVSHVFSTGSYSVSLAISDGTLTGTSTLAIQANDPGSWHITTLDTTDDAGQFCSLAEIGGMPAIVYAALTPPGGNVKYIAAKDALGSSWESPVVAALGEPKSLSLAEVNGHPDILLAITVGTDTNIALASFIGGSWGSGAFLDTNAGPDCSLVYLHDRLRAVYYKPSGSDGELRVISGLDPDGYAITAPYTIAGVSGLNLGQSCSAVDLGGSLGIAYYNDTYGTLDFSISYDDTYQAFDTTTAVSQAGMNCGPYNSLVNADGVPACFVMIYDIGLGTMSLVFKCADDVSGINWNAGNWLVATNSSGHISGAMIDGQPAVAHCLDDGSLYYSRSSYVQTFQYPDSSTVDVAAATILGVHLSMKEIGGHPCIAYYDATNKDLKFAIRY